ncbi:MAG: anion permease [Oscillospiraceae bacterium]|nr:anion permease [Oscillospiraceae bacterium]
MSTQLIICLVIFVLTCVGYMTGVWSLGTVAMTSIAALSLTGCLTAKDALAYFSNNNVIMIGAMSVVAAGFNRTQFCTNLANAISKLAKGSLSKVLLMYCILAMLLSQMVQSPVVVFGIVAPLCMASADSMNISKSKIALALGIVSIATCCTLPIGTGATQAAELNGYISAYYDKLENFTGTMPVVNFFDPMKARLPMLIFCVIYGAFVMPKFSPDHPSVNTAESEVHKTAEKKPLPAFSETAGIVVFFGTAVALMLQANVLKAVQIWQICLVGAVLMVILGVLKPKEALKSIPVSMLLLIVGALAMAGALSGTGAGDWIGGGIAKLVSAVNNNYIVGLIFFVVPFVLTQFMSNRGAMLIFIPIAIATCYQIGGDPRGLIILIQAGSLTAFMTPMATAAVPYMMEYGGYDQKDLLKGGWLFAIIGCVISVGWIMTIMPVL